ncbi:MAG TPA: DUF169 domain-containing protein [Thermoanaerobaculaceae bacterium]|nr:DUF169 domain-containing protein [Thermoanaerobaculaceae bacterium]
MDSAIARAIRAQYEPVALLFSEELPAGAMQFAEAKWGCVMWLLMAAAAKGKPAAADRNTFGCLGGGTGLGFGNRYETWPGGIECFYRFLSTGNGPQEESEAPGVRRGASSDFVYGERYVKTPDAVRRFVDALPMIDVPTRYVVLKPLSQVADGERPEIVIFLVDPDRLSALVVLANYERGDNENVIMPWGAGCQTIGILAYREARSARPRAVVGLTDLSARKYIAKQLGHNLMTFAVPYTMFQEMEANVPGSFLERDTWRDLMSLEG